MFLKCEKSPNFLAFYCILHQRELCSNVSDVPHEGYGHSGQLYLNANEPNCVALVDELEGAYEDLVLHSEVRWLSLGKVDFWLYSAELLFSNRFLDILPKIVQLIDDIGTGERVPVLKDRKWKTNLAFFADITVHLNKLNLHVDDLLVFIESLRVYWTYGKEKDMLQIPIARKNINIAIIIFFSDFAGHSIRQPFAFPVEKPCTSLQHSVCPDTRLTP